MLIRRDSALKPSIIDKQVPMLAPWVVQTIELKTWQVGNLITKTF